MGIFRGTKASVLVINEFLRMVVGCALRIDIYVIGCLTLKVPVTAIDALRHFETG